MSQTSEQELVRNFAANAAITITQPISISASENLANEAPEIEPAIENAFTVEYTGSRAVEDAIDAYNEAYRHALKSKQNETTARKAASKAYRQQIPALHNSCNIADFIACVGHALVLGIIEGPEATRLLYAAQVAHTAIPTSVRQWPLTGSRADIKAAAAPYVGPEDDWAGISDPHLRDWYQKHVPKGSRQAGAY